MAETLFEFTPEQKSLLLNSDDAILASVPESNKRFVIISEDQYDHLRRLIPVGEVDLPFFDCEEIDLSSP